MKHQTLTPSTPQPLRPKPQKGEALSCAEVPRRRFGSRKGSRLLSCQAPEQGPASAGFYIFDAQSTKWERSSKLRKHFSYGDCGVSETPGGARWTCKLLSQGCSELRKHFNYGDCAVAAQWAVWVSGLRGLGFRGFRF